MGKAEKKQTDERSMKDLDIKKKLKQKMDRREDKKEDLKRKAEEKSKLDTSNLTSSLKKEDVSQGKCGWNCEHCSQKKWRDLQVLHEMRQNSKS